MGKIIVSETVALDGVFDAQTMGKWAQPFYSEDRDKCIQDVVLASDALLLGRTTYDIQAYYWPSQQYDEYGIAEKKNQMPKYVVTSKPLQSSWNNSTAIGKNIVEEIAKLKQLDQNILIEGSAMLVQLLTQAGLIDEYRFLVHPIIVGSGKRLFNDGMGMTNLKLVDSKTLSTGVLLLSYKPT